MANRRMLLLFNPAAGKGRAAQRKTELEECLRRHDIACDFVQTKSEDHLISLTRNAAGEYDVIVGAGGDSTFTIIINEIVRSGSRPALGMVGIGSSNDITREFGLDTLEKACRALKVGRIRTIDLGAVQTKGQVVRYFLGQANIGLGVSVNRMVEEQPERRHLSAGRQLWRGTAAVFRSYRKKQVPVPLKVQWEDGRSRELFTIALFSNSRFWASGKQLCPNARVDDGRLDMCLVRDMRLPRLAVLFVRAGRGKPIRMREVRTVQAEEYSVAAEVPFDIQVDGEILTDNGKTMMFRDVCFSAVPGAARVLAKR